MLPSIETLLTRAFASAAEPDRHLEENKVRLPLLFAIALSTAVYPPLIRESELFHGMHVNLLTCVKPAR